MTLKIPPPPFLTGPQYAGFNRWLLELTSILQATGGIDPNSVAGLAEVIAQSAANAAAIVVLQALTASQGADISTLQGDVTTLQGDVVTINSALTTLGARAQLFNGSGAPAGALGNINDQYTDITNKHIYTKIGATAWLLIV